VDLSGKRIIVTGGVSGLGRAAVEKLLARDASVAVLDLDATGLGELERRHPEVQCIECDVSDYEQVVEATRRYHEVGGAAHVLVNNAGILHSEPLVRLTASGLERHDVATWARVLAADLNSVFYVSACVVQEMIATRTAGVVVNISSVAASGNAGQSAYSAAKAGVNALTATWAKELGPMGIRVVAVAPGFSATESTTHALSQSLLRDTIKKVPLRRLGKPEEIADGVLAVIENDFVTGKVFEIDGGMVL
jgi:3-oxoacyl-[acyl-carrier protein] reductase